MVKTMPVPPRPPDDVTGPSRNGQVRRAPHLAPCGQRRHRCPPHRSGHRRAPAGGARRGGRRARRGRSPEEQPDRPPAPRRGAGDHHRLELRRAPGRQRQQRGRVHLPRHVHRRPAIATTRASRATPCTGPGTTIRAVRVPGDPALVTPLTVLATEQASWRVYLLPAVLLVVAALLLVLLVYSRRRARGAAATQPEVAVIAGGESGGSRRRGQVGVRSAGCSACSPAGSTFAAWGGSSAPWGPAPSPVANFRLCWSRQVRTSNQAPNNRNGTPKPQ